MEKRTGTTKWTKESGCMIIVKSDQYVDWIDELEDL